MEYNNHIDAIHKQLHDFIYDGNSNVCPICFYEILAIKQKRKKINLENVGQDQGEKRDLCHSTEMFDFYIGEFFRI